MKWSVIWLYSNKYSHSIEAMNPQENQLKRLVKKMLITINNTIRWDDSFEDLRLTFRILNVRVHRTHLLLTLLDWTLFWLVLNLNKRTWNRLTWALTVDPSALTLVLPVEVSASLRAGDSYSDALNQEWVGLCIKREKNSELPAHLPGRCLTQEVGVR